MDLQTFLGDERSRRHFFGLAGVSLAGGSAAFLATCGADAGDGVPAAAPAEGAGAGRGDVEILNSALDLENMAIAAYAAGAGVLRGDARARGVLFLAHEREHAEALSRAIRGMGGTPNKPKDGYNFPRLAGPRDVLRFAVDLENTAVAAYLDALPKLSSGRLRATAAAIVTNEAEHLSVLLGAMGRPPVPTAFVTGGTA